MIHKIDNKLLTGPIEVTLVGSGGTGSHVLRRLAIIHKTMLTLGHPYGLNVTVYDPDTVSEANVGRQAFYPTDVGLHKATILVHRCNMMLQTKWVAIPEKFSAGTNRYKCNLIIGCVDNRKARNDILKASKQYYSFSSTYWLDFGNREQDGQVILGQVMSEAGEKKIKKQDGLRLPHAGDLFPELLDALLDDDDETPSCSLAEALEKQSLFINDTVANAGMNMLWELLRYGQISYHGVFINTKTGRANPLPIDPEAWKRFGYGVKTKKSPRKKRDALSI